MLRGPRSLAEKTTWSRAGKAARTPKYSALLGHFSQRTRRYLPQSEIRTTDVSFCIDETVLWGHQCQ
jgi:hypothetical protein